MKIKKASKARLFYNLDTVDKKAKRIAEYVKTKYKKIFCMIKYQ